MATIITKNSSTASAVPLAADLVQGELAVNVTDKRVYTKNASAAVIEVGTNPSSITTASATVTGGAVNNTPVGASTPSTGAFTTLSATGLITTNGQVKFPSSQNASADANTLDDYEEGTWTPTVSRTSSEPTVTYIRRDGHYIKVGKLVTLFCSIQLSAVSVAGSGVNRIIGLPFNYGLNSYENAGAISYNDAILTTAASGCQIQGTSVYFNATSTRTSGEINTGWGAGYLAFSIQYMADA